MRVNVKMLYFFRFFLCSIIKEKGLRMLIDTITRGTVQYYLPDNNEISSLTRVFDALSDPTRVKMLSALSITDMCVGDMSEILSINQTTISHQLKYLKDVGFVKSNRIGKVVVYSIGSKYLHDIMLAGVRQATLTK